MKSSVLKKILMATATVIAVFVLFSVSAFAEDYGNFSYTPVVPEEGETFEAYNEIAGYNAGDDVTDTVVVIPSEIEDVPVTKINASAFSGKDKITEVVIPDTVTYIDNAAFYNCTSLKIVVIPDSVTYIGESAFQGCEALEYVVIGNGVKTIGDIAFKNCKALAKVDLGESVEAIGSGAFFGCEALKEVAVPASVKSIGSLAFGFVQGADAEETVAGFTFYTANNQAVYDYNSQYSAPEDVTGAATSLTAFAVMSSIKACADDAHTVEFVNIRPATDAYEGLDVAFCSACKNIVTRPNTDVVAAETGISQYISLIICVIAVIAVVVYALVYIKKSKAHREKAIAEYKEGKTLSDMDLKLKQDEKLEAKYAKKRAKQEKRLEIFKK